MEVLVADLAALLGIPCAQVELARRDGVEGSISRNVAADGWSLVLGSVLLTRSIPDYREGRLNVPGRPGHSVANIVEALRDCGPPPGCDADAVTFLAGYLLLDAWVANQDRHDQIWAVLRRSNETGQLILAPSYDHAGRLQAVTLAEIETAVRRTPELTVIVRGGRYLHPDPARRRPPEDPR